MPHCSLVDTFRIILGVNDEAEKNRIREVTNGHERAHRTALAASEAQYRFFSSMNQELRTPLHGVLGLADLLMAEPLTERQREYVRRIVDSGRAVLGIVDKGLDLARVESGTAQLEIYEFDLVTVIEDVVAPWFDAARANGLETQLVTDRLHQVRGDPARLAQVLNELIGNAVQFTSRGYVRVVAERHEDGVRFVVSDSGRGLTEDQLERISPSAANAEAANPTRPFEGPGPAPTVWRRLIGLMNGTIDVRSERGRGTTFEMWLPLEVVSAPPLVMDEDESETLSRLSKLHQ